VTRKRVILALQVALLAAMLVFLTVEVRSSWDDLQPRLEEMRVGHVAIAAAILAAYYLVFVVGWVGILRAFGMRIGYPDAVGAEMLSMLAKYIPGGVWTPAARVVACKRIGLPPGPVLASVGYEAGLSAIAGVIVFALALPFAPDVDLPVPFWAIAGFALLLLVLLHPRIYGAAADRLLARLGDEVIPRLPTRTAAGVLAFYAVTWLLGGLVLRELCLAFGAEVPLTAVAYLGGASAIGAIVAVLVIFAPSGLGVREGAVYALLLAHVDSATALVVVALNRLLITAVEAALLAAVVALRRLRTQPAT
jgi:glycosyltransferase 2 family protein